MQNQISQLRKMIYTLKNQFGLQIIYFKNNTTPINYNTGVAVSSPTSVIIKRAIRLPTKSMRNLFAVFVKSTLGDYLETDRELIIDSKDISFRPVVDDWVEFNSEHYSIKEVHILDGHSGFLIVTSSINIPATTPFKLIDSINMTHSVQVTVT